MTAAVEQFLTSFDALSDAEKQVAVMELLDRLTGDDLATLSSDALDSLADQLFVELDAREAADEGT